MRMFLLKVAVIFTAALSFVGCEETHDFVFPLDRTLWYTENKGIYNDFYIRFNTNTFALYDNNTNERLDHGTYDYVYDYPYDLVYLYGAKYDYLFEYDTYEDIMYDTETGDYYQQGEYTY